VRVGVGGSNGVLWVGKRAAFSPWFLGLKVLRLCEISFSKERGCWHLARRLSNIWLKIRGKKTPAMRTASLTQKTTPCVHSFPP